MFRMMHGDEADPWGPWACHGLEPSDTVNLWTLDRVCAGAFVLQRCLLCFNSVPSTTWRGVLQQNRIKWAPIVWHRPTTATTKGSPRRFLTRAIEGASYTTMVYSLSVSRQLLETHHRCKRILVVRTEYVWFHVFTCYIGSRYDTWYKTAPGFIF